MTQTGEVRKVLRRKVRKNKSVENKVLSLVPENTAMYLRQHACFAGGYTHANIIFSGITLKKENGNLPTTKLQPSINLAGLPLKRPVPQRLLQPLTRKIIPAL